MSSLFHQSVLPPKFREIRLGKEAKLMVFRISSTISGRSVHLVHYQIEHLEILRWVRVRLEVLRIFSIKYESVGPKSDSLTVNLIKFYV